MAAEKGCANCGHAALHTPRWGCHRSECKCVGWLAPPLQEEDGQ